MPKTQNKKESLRHNPYTRVTPRSLNRFGLFCKEDETNITKIDREPAEYADLLGLKSLKKFITDLAIKLGRKIRILDSGCGACSTINSLLSDKELEYYIKDISGISLHYFEIVEEVMKVHTSRFHYYSGTAQNVLANALETHHAFDLILD